MYPGQQFTVKYTVQAYTEYITGTYEYSSKLHEILIHVSRCMLQTRMSDARYCGSRENIEIKRKPGLVKPPTYLSIYTYTCNLNYPGLITGKLIYLNKVSYYCGVQVKDGNHA